MRRMLQRLLGKRGMRRSTVICHLRENGPIAYELDLFATAPRERADAMTSGDLSWAWKGAARDWTELTRVSLSAFLSDVSAGDVLVIGADGELPVELSNAVIKTWIRQFSRLQPTPLAAVISVTGGRELLFVQQHASDAVNRLLDAWDLDKKAAERKAYPRLGGASLESVAERL